MEYAGDSWAARLSTSARRHQPRSDPFFGAEDFFDGDDESRPEYVCPFCSEDFDVVGLCCHIDEEHPIEAKNGICPACAKKVGMDLVSHITMQHGSIFKVMHKKRLRKGGGAHSTFSMLRKELREGSLRYPFGSPSRTRASSNTEPDPLLSSFIYSPPPTADDPVKLQLSAAAVEATSLKESWDEDLLEREDQRPVLSGKDQEEKARKCEFVQELLLSTILDEVL